MDMKKYLLGIDNGGTVSKAALFDLQGKQILQKSVQIPLITEKEGYTERSMTDIWNSTAGIISQVVRECEEYGGEIIAVGLTGHGKGLYLLGDKNEIIYNGIISTDTRALPYEVLWGENGVAEKAYEKTAQKVMACQPVSLLRWFKDNNREIYDRIKCVLSVKDYIRFCLTDTLNAEYTDVSGTNLVDLKTKEYDDGLLELFGIPEIAGKLPPIKSSTDICGGVTPKAAEKTGLKEGTPVVGGMFDIDACAVAMGSINVNDMCVIAGTWSINEYVSERIIDDGSIAMNSIFADPKYYLAEESSAVSAGNMEWFRKIARYNNCSYDELNRLAGSIEPEDCDVYYLPFLYASNENPYAKACLIGMSGHHTAAHIVRAIYEGVAFSHLKHINNLLKSREKPRSVRLAGGVANSDIWTQIFADVLDIDIEIIEDTELGAKGAAMAAGVAMGIYSDYADAAAKCVTISRKVRANKTAVPKYFKKYEKYRKIVDALNEVWNDKD